jgi:hypothetical protein
MSTYLAIGVMTMLASLAALVFTKVPSVVVLCAASAASGAFMVYARLELGYWDPFTPIAFVVCWSFAALISLAFVELGRKLKWPFFLKRQETPSAL